jgi:hypothetical protein
MTKFNSGLAHDTGRLPQMTLVLPVSGSIALTMAVLIQEIRITIPTLVWPICVFIMLPDPGPRWANGIGHQSMGLNRPHRSRKTSC